MDTKDPDIEQQQGGCPFLAGAATSPPTEDYQAPKVSFAANNDDDMQPSLHGLEKEIRQQNPSGGGGGLHLRDYMKAQRAMQMKSRRHINTTLRRRDSDNDDDARARSMRTMKEQKTIRHLGLLGKPPTNLTGSIDAGWADIFDQLELIDEDGHFHDEHGHDLMLPLYAPPVQRQRWGEDHILPHVNWGDLFFDLFYVGMAYNLGVMLMSVMGAQGTGRGLIYYIGIFGPLWLSWEKPMHYGSRYTTVDYAHRLFEVVRYLFVAAAVMSISPLALMADSKSSETLIFTGAIFVESMMHLALNIELYFRGEGDKVSIRNHTLTNIKYQLFPTSLIYLAAMIVAIVLYTKPDGDDNRHLAAAAAASDYEVDGEEKDYTSYDIESQAKPNWELSDLPLTLTAISYLQNLVMSAWCKFGLAKRDDVRQWFVPNNVEYVIHRYGEWILLMIGEGILSLLIVETIESKEYILIALFGVITIIFIQILKFESEPTHAEGHALWRSFTNAIFYSYLMQILSMALITFGVTYKVFLNDALSKGKAVDYGMYDKKARLLAASTDVISNEVSSAVFSISLAIVLLSLECTNLTHCGIKAALGHLNIGEKAHGVHWPVLVISILKIALVLFALTLYVWTVEPHVLTICGCAIVFAMSCTRVLNFFFIHQKAMTALINSVRATCSETGIQHAVDSIRTTVIGTTNETVKNINRVSKMVAFAPSAQSSSGRAQEAMAQEDFAQEDLARTSNYSTNLEDSERKSEVGSTSSTVDTGVSSQRELTTGLSNSFDGIVVADLHGIITQVNDTAVKLFGYETNKEMIGKNLSFLCGGTDGKRHDAYMKAFRHKIECSENPSQKVLGRQRMLHGRKADGSDFPVVIGIKLVQKNTRIAGYIRDMSGIIGSEHKRASDDLRIESAIEHFVDDNAFDAIIASNESGIIERVNARAVTEFGYKSKDELVGESIDVIFKGAVNHPKLRLKDGVQRVETLTSKDGTKLKGIVATKTIQGTRLEATYFRNLEPVATHLGLDS